MLMLVKDLMYLNIFQLNFGYCMRRKPRFHERVPCRPSLYIDWNQLEESIVCAETVNDFLHQHTAFTFHS